MAGIIGMRWNWHCKNLEAKAHQKEWRKIDAYYICKLIEQIRSQYKIGFVGRLKRKFIMSTAGLRFRRMARRNGIEL